MSISQDYEEIKQKLGKRKYEALNEYIDTFGNIKAWEYGLKQIRNIENINEWEKQYIKLHEKYKPIFLEDVYMNEQEWNKFEAWYQEKIKKINRNKDAR